MRSREVDRAERRRRRASCSRERRHRARAREPGVDPPDERDDHQRLARARASARRSAPGSVTTRVARLVRRGRVASARRATADLHRAPAGRDVRPAPRASPSSPRSSASTRSSGPTTTSASATATPGPGSTDAWVTLAALGRETSRIRLGTLVTPVTFRLPGPLAIQVAQADAMSGGRVELGLGAGWYDAEHAAYGDPVPADRRRASRCSRSSSRSSTGLWTTPRRRARTRSRARTTRSSTRPRCPKPVQRPRPPIILGGWGTKRTPRLAARYADEFNMPFAPVVVLPRGLRPRARARARRSAAIPATMRFTIAVVVCVGRDEAEFDRRADRERPGSRRAARRTRPAGTPAEVVERIREFDEGGRRDRVPPVPRRSTTSTTCELIAAEVAAARYV